MAPKASQGKKASQRKNKQAKKSKSPRCRICERAIPVPKGWSTGPAVRRHYWAKHREVMQKKAGS